MNKEFWKREGLIKVVTAAMLITGGSGIIASAAYAEKERKAAVIKQLQDEELPHPSEVAVAAAKKTVDDYATTVQKGLDQLEQQTGNDDYAAAKETLNTIYSATALDRVSLTILDQNKRYEAREDQLEGNGGLISTGKELLGGGLVFGGIIVSFPRKTLKKLTKIRPKLPRRSRP